MAGRGVAALDAFRAADAGNKPFATQYDNAEIHRGALAQPEFSRRELTPSGRGAVGLGP